MGLLLQHVADQGKRKGLQGNEAPEEGEPQGETGSEVESSRHQDWYNEAMEG